MVEMTEPAFSTVMVPPPPPPPAVRLTVTRPDAFVTDVTAEPVKFNVVAAVVIVEPASCTPKPVKPGMVIRTALPVFDAVTPAPVKFIDEVVAVRVVPELCVVSAEPPNGDHADEFCT